MGYGAGAKEKNIVCDHDFIKKNEESCIVIQPPDCL
jgi:hypothetical protein